MKDRKRTYIEDDDVIVIEDIELRQNFFIHSISTKEFFLKTIGNET